MTNLPPLTLLSPARNTDVARAAIRAGADAVYIGAPRFGARQAAGNSIDDIRALVRYARPYGVDILVTLNTLLTDAEKPEAVQMAWDLYEAGVSALIIQDLTLLKENLPPIRLHASTQCDNRTPEQAVRMQQLGFRRLVLARELGISEIQAIREATLQDAAARGVEPIELEAFVHGALCVCYSGRCYLSEQLTGRSANRGCCAQLCRLPYDLLDADMQLLRDDNGQPLAQQYALSLQDLDRSAYLAELIAAGVTTFKIEGRLKDEAYVTNITAYYREKIDQIVDSQTTNDQRPTTKRTFIPNPEKSFHRGQTDYFLHGRTPHMANWLTPKSTGEYIGSLLEARGTTLRIQLREGITLHNGDGLTIGAEGCSVNGIDGNLIRINKPLSLSRYTGIPVYRNLDTEFTKNLHAERRVPVDILFEETPDGLCLTYSTVDGRQTGTVNCQLSKNRSVRIRIVNYAKNADRALQTIREQLSKLGDTPYEARSIEIQTQPYFIPISVLNQWRREAVARLTDSVPVAPEPVPHQSVAVSNPERPEALMTCRYCILHELGRCRKQGTKKIEPKYLRTSTGTLLRLEFDCKRCEMRIYLA